METLSNEYVREIVLSKCRDKFIRDFEFNDIHRDLSNANVLPLTDLDMIARYASRDDLVDALFFLLVIRGDEVFNAFKYQLRAKYDWLYQGIERAEHIIRDIAPSDLEYHDKLVELRKELPKFVDYNIHRCDLLRKIRQTALALNRQQCLVVHGSLSEGKQWIVMDALCSYEVMCRMRGNIFWIYCGKCRVSKANDESEMVLQQLERLYIKSERYHEIRPTLSTYSGIKQKALNYTETLKQIFEKGDLRDCLVVLVDVQDYETVRAFDVNCRTIITTRDKTLLDKLSNATYKIEVKDGLTDNESKELFAKVLGTSTGALPNEAIDLQHLCKGNPFVISVIASNLKLYNSSLTRWVYWKDTLERNQPTNFEPLRRPIEESLRDLKVHDLQWYKYFEEMVIFTDNVFVPVKRLAEYWNLPLAEAEVIVFHLDALYLLQATTLNGVRYCSLHYLYYTYLNSNVNAAQKQSLHGRLVSSYRIPEALSERSELNLLQLPNDNYFHYYIGYHLKGAGPAYHPLYKQLYNDFGFLEQKLRNSGLSNTLGDFKLYGDQIGDRGVCDDWTEFLAYIEEYLVISADTCLLQHALSKDRHIGEQARQQAERFNDRIWFSDNDHSVKYRQIIKLPEHIQPTRILFMEPNTSLIAFNDHSIYLIDMSYEYTVEPTQYLGHKQRICDMQLFLSDFFVSLDEAGSMIVWSLKETEIARRRVSRTISPPNARTRQQEPLQTINNNDCVTSILIHQTSADPPKLFAATAKGKMLLFYWSPAKKMFEQRESHSFTVREHIVKMCIIEALENILMTVNREAQLAFYSLRDQGFIAHVDPKFPNEAPLNIFCLSPAAAVPLSRKHIFAVVFASGIHQIHVTKKDLHSHEMMYVECMMPYKLAAEQNAITCAAKTDDNRYLVLGTKKGIIVLDKTNREILRSSISDNLTSIDVCTVQDSGCNYMVISATRKGKSVAYVHGINFGDNLMQWSTNKVDSPMNARVSTVAWFRGEKAFDVCYSGPDIDDRFTLVAADLQNVVHTKHSGDGFSQTVSLEQFENDVKNISIGQRRKYVGCRSGEVWDVDNGLALAVQLDASVKYLKYYDDIDVLVAGSRSQYKIMTHKQAPMTFASALIQNTFVYADRFIVVLKIDGSFEMLELVGTTCKVHPLEQPSETNAIICSDWCNDKIVVGVAKDRFSIYTIGMGPGKAAPTILLLNTFQTQSRDLWLRSICLTETDRLLIAVGYETGPIDLFDVTGDEAQLVKRFRSHRLSVKVLRFSAWHLAQPQHAHRQPLILVSLSEEICFWDINHALNNPIERTQLRTSQRFNRPKSSTDLNGNSSQLANSNGQFLHPNGPAACVGNGHSGSNGAAVAVPFNKDWPNPWAGKCGSAEKPELLCCIKFVGSSAEKIFINQSFTKFITVDNEGEIYYLKTLDFQSDAIS